MAEAGRRNLLFLLRGYGPTLAVSFASWGLSVVIGLALAVIGLMRSRVAQAVNRIYVNMFRSAPVIALSLCDAAFEAEIFRAGNQFVHILTISSIVSVIGYGELTRKANELNVSEYRPLEIDTILILEYLVIILLASYFVKRLERAMATY